MLSLVTGIVISMQLTAEVTILYITKSMCRVFPYAQMRVQDALFG